MKQLVTFLGADRMHYGPLAHDFCFIPGMKHKTALEHNKPPDGPKGSTLERFFPPLSLQVSADPKSLL